MNVQQLEYIIALDRFNSFTLAADHCNITQATLSTMIKKLEDELKVTLFDRRNKPVSTTPVGKKIIAEAQQMIASVKRIAEIASIDKSKIEGSINIGIIPTIANSLLPLIIKPLVKKYPDLQLNITEITTQLIIQRLKEGKLDAGIIATPVDHDVFDEEVLYYESLWVYGDIKKNRKYVVTDDLVKHQHWLLQEGHCLRDSALQLCSLSKSVLPQKFHLEANSLETLLNMTDDFGGLTIIPELYANGLSNTRKEKVHQFKAPIPVRETTIVSYRNVARQHIIQAIAAEVKALVTPCLQSTRYKKNELLITA